MNFTTALSEFVASAEPPVETADTVANAIADCFGCILAGKDSEVAVRVHEGLLEHSPGKAPIYGTDLAASPGCAALANAVAGHAYDLDDWEEPGNTHPTIVMLPALLAASTLKPVTGRTMLSAYAVGFEVIARLGETVTLDHYARGFHSTATLGAIGTAAAVSRVLGLTAEQTSNAMALSVSQAVGYTKQFGTNAKPLQAGFAARAGLEAGLLARAGITANSEILISDRGFSGLMGNHNKQVAASAEARLGKPWAVEAYGIVLKPWCSCGYTHRLMTAALEMRETDGFQCDEIAKIEARQPDFHNAILPFDRPKSRNQALFSAPACIAQILVSGNLTLLDGENRFWENPSVARLINLCEVVAEPTLNPSMNYDPQQPDILIVHMSNGDRREIKCAYPLGAPQRSMSKVQLAEKFQSVTGRHASQFARLLSWVEAENVAAFFERAGR